MPQALPIRVVVVTMYEPGLETAGAHFGEFRLWAEGLPLPELVPFPYGFRELRHNAEKGVLGIVLPPRSWRSAWTSASISRALIG